MLYTFLSITLAVVLARLLKPEGYGVYTYVFSLISFIAIPAQFGFPTLLVREVAKAQVTENWVNYKSILIWTGRAVATFSLVLVLIFSLFIWGFVDQLTKLQLMSCIWGLFLIPLITLGNLRGAALRGLRKVIQGQLPEMVIRPGIFLVLLLIVPSLNVLEEMDASNALLLHVIAATIAFLVGLVLLWFAHPVAKYRSIMPIYQHKVWLASAFPLAMAAGMQVINKYTDIIILGWFVSAEDIGLYSVAVQGATLVAFGLQSINMVILPHFARLYEQGNMIKLQQLVTLSARVILLMAIPVVFLFLFFGETILAQVFGEDYIPATTALCILAVGQLVNAGMGSVGGLLRMTGHESIVAKVVTFSAIINIVLNFILIPLYGINGAAIATAVSLSVWNIVMWKLVQHHLNINSIAFFKLKKEL